MIRYLTLLVLVIGLVGCLGAEFMAHYDKGTKAAADADYETCISELEAAIKVNPSDSSVTYHRLAFCYEKVGRHQDAWWAIRQGVIINPLSGERRQAFQRFWEAKKNSGLVLGLTVNEVRQRLGTPDVEAYGSDTVLLGYGLVALNFESGVLVKISE